MTEVQISRIDELAKFEQGIHTLSMNDLSRLNKMVVEQIRHLRRLDNLNSISQFIKGDLVKWIANDGTVNQGMVIRLNQKSVTVKCEHQLLWKISPQLLHKWL